LERLSAFGHRPGDEAGSKFVGSSAATTVVRKTISSKGEPRSSISSDATRTHSFEQNHQVLTNKHAEQNQRKTSLRQSITNPFSNSNYNNSYTGQQLLLTSGDIEAMTMKQFRMGSLGY
jgi:hypothetical protein